VEVTVTQVESVGMGDRVCVDLCNLLHPGEGLLVSCSCWIANPAMHSFLFTYEARSDSEMILSNNVWVTAD
jgi:3-dehydroquinate synthase class II